MDLAPPLRRRGTLRLGRPAPESEPRLHSAPASFSIGRTVHSDISERSRHLESPGRMPFPDAVNGADVRASAARGRVRGRECAHGCANGVHSSKRAKTRDGPVAIDGRTITLVYRTRARVAARARPRAHARVSAFTAGLHRGARRAGSRATSSASATSSAPSCVDRQRALVGAADHRVAGVSTLTATEVRAQARSGLERRRAGTPRSGSGSASRRGAGSRSRRGCGSWGRRAP